MFDRLLSWLFRGRDAAARAEEAASKAWLDELRQNELSVNARRRLAPDEPVKAPGIAHGSAEAVTDIERLAAGFSRQPAEKKRNNADYAEDGGLSAEGGPGTASSPGDAGGAFGGGGSDGDFGSADVGVGSSGGGDSD